MKKYFILFTVSLIVYFTHAAATLQGLYGDGNGYYSYTNTIYFQRNLDFVPIYDHLSNFSGTKYIFSRIFWDKNYNPFTIGTGLVWLPSMGFISIVNSVFSLNAGRFDLIYELGPGITGIILVIYGLFFLEKYLLTFFSSKIVTPTILSLFFTTHILYYSAFEPGLSHQPSFFLISFLLWWSASFSKTIKNFFILGLLSGFLITIRMVDLIFLIPIFWQIKPNPKDLIPFLTGLGIGVLPQMVNQYYMFGNVLINPYFTGLNGSWEFNLVHIFEVLFSPKRGLILWSPIFAIGFWGLIKSKRVIFIFPMVIMLLIVSSWSAYLTAGFGGRMFFSAIPFFAYGIAYMFKGGSAKMFGITLACVLWNFLLIKNVYLHKDLFIQSPDFTYKEFITYMLKLN